MNLATTEYKMAEDAEIAQLQARLDGLTARYEESQTIVAELRAERDHLLQELRALNNEMIGARDLVNSMIGDAIARGAIPAGNAPEDTKTT